MSRTFEQTLAAVEVRPVQDASDLKAFIDLPWKIYRADPYWVPQLKIAVKDILDVKKNPFFRHAERELFLARLDGEVVGRVAAIVDHNHNQFHKDKLGFFGFFEVMPEPAVATALMNEVKSWIAAKGLTTLRGPMNPSTNHEMGLLIDGFQDAPSVMMTYNPSYYIDYLEANGFRKAKDVYAYDITAETKFSDRLTRHSERMRSRSHITFREINLKKFEEEVDLILEIYNDAWENNWGFVPMENAEFRHLAKDMKAIVDPRLVLVAEVDGKAAGFSLALPDVNQVFAKIPNGKLLPTGLVKLLWYLKGPGRKSTINRCRIITLGVRKEYQQLGLGPLFYTEYLRRGPAFGYPTGECSWILEDNIPMNRALEFMGAKRTKTYRVYDTSLV